MNKTLETSAATVQNFGPLKNHCAHLNAFHTYADAPGERVVEANHYCGHLNDEVRQCLLYDSPNPGARLIGIEYMISARLFETLDPEEQKLWHTHVFEVKSGMLIMPKPSAIPDSAWEVAENKEMEQVATLYGKVFHTWQVDRGDKLPLGEAKLMTSFTKEGQFPNFEKTMDDRDERFGADWRRKREVRSYIDEPKLNPNADITWNKKK
ncbi:DUF1264-domain-containing protein [Delitschia confertaspora ATCC 74209]|uniref:DUF1264-domain-containing protein n=1 Tax=Delitschia confertaspora ATCC 74209 TaxID=1513339 RepID=A0A9P4MTQ5_9PLEO|nr:DUF1264-domain-containing protein [Delitschia confertaspora ATCC 74209]